MASSSRTRPGSMRPATRAASTLPRSGCLQTGGFPSRSAARTQTIQCPPVTVGEQPPGRRCRGDGAGHFGLAPQHGQVRNSLSAVSEHHRQDLVLVGHEVDVTALLGVRGGVPDGSDGRIRQRPSLRSAIRDMARAPRSRHRQDSDLPGPDCGPGGSKTNVSRWSTARGCQERKNLRTLSGMGPLAQRQGEAQVTGGAWVVAVAGGHTRTVRRGGSATTMRPRGRCGGSWRARPAGSMPTRTRAWTTTCVPGRPPRRSCSGRPPWRDRTYANLRAGDVRECACRAPAGRGAGPQLVPNQPSPRRPLGGVAADRVPPRMPARPLAGPSKRAAPVPHGTTSTRAADLKSG